MDGGESPAVPTAPTQTLHGQIPTLSKKIYNAFIDMCHPFLLLS
jgi:hypothetical protein